MSVYVTDTHPLVWFGNGRTSNLSKHALNAFSDAELGRAFIHIPAMVLYEVAILERQGRIKLDNGFVRWTEVLLRNDGFGVAPLEPAIMNAAVGFAFNGDPFDKAIVATAYELSLPLITRDSAITASALVDIHW